MTTLFRPIYAGFDAQRPAAINPRTSGSYHRLGNLANDDLTAFASQRLLRPTRAATPFAEIHAR